MLLVEKLRSGDPEAWEQAFNGLYSVAHEAAKSRLGDKYNSECEDVAIESLNDLAKKELKMSSELELRALVAAIARNKAVDRLKHFSAAKRGGNRVESIEALQESAGGETVGSSQDHFIDQLTVTELGDLLTGLALQLKKGQRVILRDHYLNQMTYEEIAKKHQISVNSVGVYLQRALAGMKSVIARKPGLMDELTQLAGVSGIVKVLIPLVSAVQLGRWFVETGVLYSEESQISPTRTLSDEEKLSRSPENLPQSAVLAENQQQQLMELARRKFPASFKAWHDRRRLDQIKNQETKPLNRIGYGKGGCATLAILAVFIIAIVSFVFRAIR